MAFVQRVLYRKINPSDFKKMYNIDKPASGGGQTYIELAGISNDDVNDFFEYANSVPSDIEPDRLTYHVDTYVLGSDNHQELEIAPRNGRNYKISRQNLGHKHMAWSPENGFPLPRIVDGTYSKDFNGIIDNLIIYIIRTSDRQYFASFVNSSSLPDSWPSGIGLEQMFSGERRGVLRFDNDLVFFENNRNAPFSTDDFFPNFEINMEEGQPEQVLEIINDFADDYAIRNAPVYDNEQDINNSNNRQPLLREGQEQNHRYSTDPRLSKTVISRCGFICELDNFDRRSHETFLTRSGNHYLEAHHLVPMKAQRYFDINLDRTENIVALCPNCHKAVHYGSRDEKIRYLRPLYDSRIDSLRECGIDISFDDLIDNYY